jgi:hypothetical protein
MLPILALRRGLALTLTLRSLQELYLKMLFSENGTKPNEP